MHSIDGNTLYFTMSSIKLVILVKRELLLNWYEVYLTSNIMSVESIWHLDNIDLLWVMIKCPECHWPESDSIFAKMSFPLNSDFIWKSTIKAISLVLQHYSNLYNQKFIFYIAFL